MFTEAVIFGVILYSRSIVKMKPNHLGNQKVVVFDVDGVVLHPTSFGRRLLAEHGIPPETTRTFFTNEFVECQLGLKDLIQSLDKYIGLWGWKGTSEDLMRYWFACDSQENNQVLSHLKKLKAKGTLCCAASNQEHSRAKFLDSNLNFSTLFSHTFYSCNLGVRKPNRQFYTTIAQQLHVNPEFILYWDDEILHVEAANASGWNAHQFTDFSEYASITEQHISQPL